MTGKRSLRNDGSIAKRPCSNPSPWCNIYVIGETDIYCKRELISYVNSYKIQCNSYLYHLAVKGLIIRRLSFQYFLFFYFLSLRNKHNPSILYRKKNSFSFPTHACPSSKEDDGSIGDRQI